MTDRGVAVAQAARDLEVAKSVLRLWMRRLNAPIVSAAAVGTAGRELFTLGFVVELGLARLPHFVTVFGLIPGTIG